MRASPAVVLSTWPFTDGFPWDDELVRSGARALSTHGRSRHAKLRPLRLPRYSVLPRHPAHLHPTARRNSPVPAFYVPAGFRVGTPGRKLKRPQMRDCQRCGKTFRATRDVPYCLPCFKEKLQR